MTQGEAVLAEGDLPGSFAAGVELTGDNKLMATLPLVNNFKGALSVKTGLMKGTFQHPLTLAPAKPTAWGGVLLQDWNFGRGHFTGTNLSGTVSLDPTP